MKATVISVSKNTNSFGYKGIVVLTEEGQAQQVLAQAYGTDTVPEKGDDIETTDKKFISSEKYPDILPSLAKQLIKKIKHETNKT
jgi:hypothetical protein